MTNTNQTSRHMSNPFVKDEAEGARLNADLMALYRVASLLWEHDHLQVTMIKTWLFEIIQDSREIMRALTWEICHSVRQHAEMGVHFPKHDSHENCPCPVDHSASAKAYNDMVAQALTGDFHASVHHVDSFIGERAYSTLLEWVGIMSDRLGELRIK